MIRRVLAGLQVRHKLRIGVDVYSEQVRVWQEHTWSGRWEAGLPAPLAHFAPRLDQWASILAGHFEEPQNTVDLVSGWDDPDRAEAFLDEARRLQDEMRLSGWDIRVDPEPGIAVIRLMGEHGVRWPLWTTGTLTDPEDWPMLSDNLKVRLEAWAKLMDPSATWHAELSREEFSQLVADLKAELGPRFEVRLANWEVV